MGMDVELLVVPNCPSEKGALALALGALRDVGLAGSVTTTVITTDAQAVTRGFTGSPTFLVNGLDPFAVPGASVGVACRLYRTPDGLTGLPPMEALRAALRSQPPSGDAG